MKPAKSILDPTFEYIDAAKTDIRLRFERIRRDMAKQQGKSANVQPIVRKAAK